AQLGLVEALTLVVIPQAPLARSPTPGGLEPPALTAARSRLFARWVEEHPATAGESGLMQVGLHYGGSRTLPFEAAHVSNALLTRASGERFIDTTIDLRRQQLVERVLQNYVREQQRVGIRNASALLVDRRDMSVRAVVGSARFFDAQIQGQ